MMTTRLKKRERKEKENELPKRGYIDGELSKVC